MQATAINNLKKAKGVDLSKESTPQGSGKGDLLQVRLLGMIVQMYEALFFSIIWQLYL